MAAGLNWFSGLFLDSTPSIVAAVAIFTTIALFVVTILVSGGSATFGQKIGSSVLLFLVLLPSIGLSLFDITCLMRGGDETLCGVLGWVKALLIVLYTGLIGVMTVMILMYGKQLKYDGFQGGAVRRVKFTDLANANIGSGAEQEPVYVGPLAELDEKKKKEGFQAKRKAGFTDASGSHVVLVNSTPTIAAASAPAKFTDGGSAAPAAPAASAPAAPGLTDLAGGLGAYLTGADIKEKEKEKFFGGSATPVPMSGATAMASYPF